MCKPILFTMLALSACTRPDEEPGETVDRDPVIAAALADPLLADPDLTGQNMGGAALTGGGPATAPIPPDKRGRDESDAALAAARDLLGGTIEPAPPAATKQTASRLAGALTAPAIARALGLGTPACADRVDYSAIWAARLAPPFEVYPRGHVGQSAGTDAPGCRLRVVGFSTPVAPDEVLAFYATRARRAGFAVARRDEGADSVLSGGKGTARYAVAARDRGDGLTEAILVVSAPGSAATPR
ncbi:hypothetical protein B0I00_1166 [Novosphingobium kunmingense]|uniref:Uncharacterized protein n=1 Tax=Novosphingobium kunmingense TaxID=1211806 RepID=A0A2N0I435_9SPHN|nr:hypothetical protein [Novosphingobium kunmingense]PKB25958.1 hypothetical protein B0I00_1166 [Novosphingobium kunmingense]